MQNDCWRWYASDVLCVNSFCIHSESWVRFCWYINTSTPTTYAAMPASFQTVVTRIVLAIVEISEGTLSNKLPREIYIKLANMIHVAFTLALGPVISLIRSDLKFQLCTPREISA